MPQLRIICLAHPAVWADIKETYNVSKKLLGLKTKSASWLDLKKEIGTRRGVYKEPSTVSSGKFVLVPFMAEAKVNPEYKSLENLLLEEGKLPSSIRIPEPIPRASKAMLFFDVEDGLCYAFTPGTPTPLEAIEGLLRDLKKDTGLEFEGARTFVWRTEMIQDITEAAREEGFTPYKVKGKLETVEVTAIGDLDRDPDWRKIEKSVQLGRWSTLAYVKQTAEGPFIFGLTRRRSKAISLPVIKQLSNDELLKRFQLIRKLFEKALTQDIRQYCFPESLATLSGFFR